VLALRDTITALTVDGADSVVVMPVQISTSPLSTVRVPADLVGLPVRYTRLPLAQLTQLARWIERMGAEPIRALQVAGTG
jgi:hypothetical protein